MSPIAWAIRPLIRYSDFSGRASRAEFWWYFLLTLAIGVTAAVIERMNDLVPPFLPYGPLTSLITLTTFTPTLAVQVRRLHDTGRSGWWLALVWLPCLLVLFLSVSILDSIGSGDITSLQPVDSLALLAFMMVAGLVALVVLFALRGTRGPNRYGADPYANPVTA